ncbi:MULTISPECIES: integrase [Pseudomonas]|uniref:integrase n=1 Tax=Pseudomonas TaxID=286 RepID=UPI000CFFDCB5|nr:MULTISPECIES: integrase [Pseudomonas]PRA54705.1 integrase [Pseudomonas sp. MYb115]QXN49711.1 integrase [Pseudomonas fluorescens]WSO24025.1 integrase [Pseudomonas fluorescens]
MAKIFKFTPGSDTNAKANVQEFITRCREGLDVFGPEVNWDSNFWTGVVGFTKAGVNPRKVSAADLLNSDIIPFAKAYVTYRKAHNPSARDPARSIVPIRCIEPALLKIKKVADISLVDPVVLDHAAAVARECYPFSGNMASSELNRFVKFLLEHKLVSRAFHWKCSIPGPKGGGRTDREGKKASQDKMPPEHVLNYMAEMFSNNPQNLADKYVVSLFALLMSAPARISEVHDLPLDCLHSEKDRYGSPKLGLRFYSGKGFGPAVKWIPTVFKDVTAKAVERLKELTDEGRRVAKWYEDHPDQFYRHAACPAVDDNTPLTVTQVCDALGVKYRGLPCFARAFLKNLANPIASFLHENSITLDEVTLAILNRYARSRLPKDFPWKNKQLQLKWSDSLFCMRANELHHQRGVSPIIIWGPGSSSISSALSITSGTREMQTVWDRNGYKNPDGSRVSLTTHQVRHFLNTTAQRGDLGQFDIARWSGRANVSQNNTYNHMTDDEHLEKINNFPALTALAGPLGKIAAHAPVTLADLGAIGDVMAHVTEFGFCVHDYSMLPCQKHRDCLNCGEQVCVKGDDEKLARLTLQRDAIALQLAQAEQALGEGYYGADRWTVHQQKTLDRANQLISLLQADDLEAGALVRLRNDQEFSPLKRELSATSSQPKLSEGVALETKSLAQER